MKKATVLWLLIVLMSLSTQAQQQTIVSGRVLSGTTGKAIPGASVSGGGQSVVTNDDGYFQLKSNSQLTSIVVSHVGYRSEHLKEKSGKWKTEGLHIRLQPTTIQLKEVLIVAGGDPRSLVEAAIEKIPKNYSQQPELYRCFYRETAMKRQRHIMVAEGVVDMFKTSYNYGVKRDRVAIRKGRRLLSPRSGDTLGIKVLGGPVVPVQLDVVKNPDFLLNEAELDCYAMKMEPPTTIDDRRHFVVSISPRRPMPYALYYGRLYIDQETLAFSRIELNLDVSDREKASALMLIKKPAGVRFRPKELSLLVDYRPENGIMHIRYVRATFRFNCDWKKKFFATSFTACCEMAVTSREDNGVDKPLSGHETFDQRDAFYDKVDFFLDPAFWQDYNIIEPTESLDRAIGKLLKLKRKE